MNLKGIRRNDGQWLFRPLSGTFVPDRAAVYRFYFTDEAIERAREFPDGTVTVVDLDDSDRQIWPVPSRQCVLDAIRQEVLVLEGSVGKFDAVMRAGDGSVTVVDLKAVVE